MSVEGDLFHRASHLPFQGVEVASPSSGANPGPAPAPPTIPDHALRCRIGGGSYGDVWLARNVMGTYRAVKVVHSRAFKHDRPFEREFEGLQKFEPVSRTHEGLVDILQVGRNDHCLYYVMELADDASGDFRVQKATPKSDGRPDTPCAYAPRTLSSDLAQRERLPVTDCIDIGRALTKAANHLHQHGLVHRDIKPSNIIFVDGEPKLADIGLVAARDSTMSFVGTAGYVPPEGPGTAQADIYSLGKVLYECAFGMDRQEFPRLPAGIREASQSAQLFEFNAVLLKACESHPAKRYASADEMHQDLLRLQQGKSVRRAHALKRRLMVGRKVLSALGVAALAGLVFHYLWHAPATGRNSLSTLFSKLELNHGRAGTEKRLRTRIALTLQHTPVPESRFTDIADGPRLYFSPDGTQVLSIDEHPTAEVYDRQAGTYLFCLDHDQPLLFGGFSPNGTRLFTVTQEGVGHFWQAASGRSIATHQFREDFSDPDRQWKTVYPDPSIASYFTYTYASGNLRIQADPGDAETWRAVGLLPPEGDTAYSDVVLSIDILDWDEGLKNMTVCLLARHAELKPVKGGVPCYAGHVTFEDGDIPEGSSFGVGRGNPIKEERWQPDPDKSYRMVFAVVGTDLHLNLYDLDDLSEPVETVSATEDLILDPGFATLWVNTTQGHHLVKGPGAYDVTVDNFVMTGTVAENPASGK